MTEAPPPGSDIEQYFSARRYFYSPARKAPLRRTNRRTLLFCTSYCENVTTWNRRCGNWLRGIEMSGICYDVIAMIDDASPALPDWQGVEIAHDLTQVNPKWTKLIYRFPERLGRSGILDMPGWYRSFAFSSQLAEHLNCDRIVHIESDAYLLSSGIVDYLDTAQGWNTVWARSKSVPETGIQVIAEKALPVFREWVSLPYDIYRDSVLELLFPFTHVEHSFRGDRHGETLSQVPWDADWTMQVPDGIFDTLEAEKRYFWFLNQQRFRDHGYHAHWQARWIDFGNTFVSAGGIGWRIETEGVEKWIAMTTDRKKIMGYFDTADQCAEMLLVVARNLSRKNPDKPLTLPAAGHVTVPATTTHLSRVATPHAIKVRPRKTLPRDTDHWLTFDIHL